MAPEKTVLVVLVVLSAASIIAGLGTSGHVAVIHSLSVGLISSSIFYFCVVYIPERQKRKRVRDRLQAQYRSIKLDVIDLLLMLSDSQFYRDRENLLDQQEFKRFFKSPPAPDSDKRDQRWYVVASALENNEYHFREVLYYLRMLNEEIRYAMTVIDIRDERVADYLTNCSQVLSRMDIAQHDYDDIKLLCRNLWSLYTGWSFVGGYPDTDVIQDMIDRIK